MGVPALFRWLSKKYPKIVQQVVEDTPSRVRQDDGTIVEVPVQFESANPNGFEVDNLYLDMNGIVHPCTHPEGKPAPETEEEMMVEVFKYTERVVNMARPRKVLLMAIDGVAPRAKMNQQRSRRFRSAQEAAEKEEERKESIRLFEAMGHPVSEETKNRKTWDSNAITPGTPFMDLLSASLKYWVSTKLSTDPGWKDLKVIISDASVPGEGEHKIVDWIRRQRTYPEWDANTSHAIYGLDADLIMLALATHEPNFRVLREDVFAQGSKGPQACRNCGKNGHLAANCKTAKPIKDPNVVEKAKPVDPKPFIWLDVSILREYLAVELNIPNVPFAFDPELAIDDWIFLIFFVGNDFLPHLPSLEIREGAIDVLLKIWRNELPRMGGYLTNNGKVNLGRAQIILDGIAVREDEIFQKRKEDEERQDARQKRRRVEEHNRQDRDAARNAVRDSKPAPGTMTMNGTDYVAVTPSDTARGGALHPSLPQRPGFDIVPKEEVKPARRPGKKLTKEEEAASLKAALVTMSGSNADVVKNRKAIRMANMSAAAALKAELEGGDGAAKEEANDAADTQPKDEGDVKPSMDVDEPAAEGDDAGGDDDETMTDPSDQRGQKRKADEEDDDEDDDDAVGYEDDDDAPTPNPDDKVVAVKKNKVNPDGTVDYEDTVRLFEPGYRERYYRQKFGVELSDKDFMKQITRSYMEGLCWVLEYYYQGVPAWDWFYPYHFAPFAQDFKNVGELDITFQVAMPFTPFGQLLGVFPAASRIHLPEPLQKLMIDEDSPILDFYPSDFEIDMNGKKMAWQGVALLPFIDQKRLLAALKSKEDQLTDDEKRRNKWGDNVMFIAEDNLLFDPFCKLYAVKAPTKPVPIDPKASLGVQGSVLADPHCVPNATLATPIPSMDECPDLEHNSSLSVRYYFPRQAHPHRSKILNGYRPPGPRLNEGDRQKVRRGGGGNHGPGRGGRDRGDRPMHTMGPGRGGQRSAPYSNAPNTYGGAGGAPAYGAGGYGGAGGGYGAGAYPPAPTYGGGGGGNYGRGGYGAPAPVYGGAGGGRNPYGAAAAAPSYGGGYGGSYGGAGGASYGGGGYGGASAAYGGGNYGAGRNTYGGAPPPNPYAAAPAYGRQQGYGGAGAAPAARGGYGGSGGARGAYGGGGYGGTGGARGGQPRRY